MSSLFSISSFLFSLMCSMFLLPSVLVVLLLFHGNAPSFSSAKSNSKPSIALSSSTSRSIYDFFSFTYSPRFTLV
ncbi:hypothetical protein N665_0400s0041 [Sinapis alba]|nr:hypothetical protein N665_0400s0041 [Sinapis alba]